MSSSQSQEDDLGRFATSIKFQLACRDLGLTSVPLAGWHLILRSEQDFSYGRQPVFAVNFVFNAFSGEYFVTIYSQVIQSFARKT